MDKVILETRFDDVILDTDREEFYDKMQTLMRREVSETEVLAMIAALARQAKAYHPRRHSEGYNLYYFALCRVKDSLSNMSNKKFINPTINWAKSLIESGWTAANADFLIEVIHLIPKEYFTSITKSQLSAHFSILNITDFEFSKEDDLDNQSYVRNMQNQFTRNFFFDYITSALYESSIEEYQELLKILYLKCWSKNSGSIDVYSRMIQTLYRQFSDIYKQKPDQYIPHFTEITAKILQEDVPTSEGQTEVIYFFTHNYQIIGSNNEVAEKIMVLWITTFFNLYKLERSWIKKTYRTFIDAIALPNLSKAKLENCEILFDDATAIFTSMIKSFPATTEGRESRQESQRLLESFSSNYFQHIIKTPEQFAKVIPMLLELIHFNENDTTEIYTRFLRNLEKKLPSFFKTKPELINPFLNQFVDTAIFFGETEDTTIKFPFDKKCRKLSDAYNEIKSLGKTTRAFNSSIVQENFYRCFTKVFNNYSLCAESFISNFYEFLIFKDYSAENMLILLQLINKTISMDLFHIYNPSTFSISSLYGNIIEFVCKSMKKYSSSMEEIVKTAKILLKYDLYWDENGEISVNPSSTFLISIFSNFLMNKTDSSTIATFYPLLFEVIEKTDESHGYYSTWISYLFSCPTIMKNPEILSPFIEDLIHFGEKLLNSDLQSYICSFLLGLSSICTPNSSCLLPYLTNLESFLVELEDDTSNFNMIIGLYNTVYTNYPEKISESVVLKIASKINVDLSSACQAVAFLGIVSKTNAQMLIPLLTEIFTCLETHKIYVSTIIINILTNILQYDPKLGENIFDSIVKIIEENLNEIMFINGFLYGLKSLAQLRHDLLVKLKDKIEKWKKEYITLNDMCQALLDIIADRSLATFDEDLSKQKKIISSVDTRLVKTEDKVKVVEKDLDSQKNDINDFKQKVDETNVKVEKLENDVELLDEQVQEIDLKTVSSAPKWAREVSKLMNPESDNDWRLLASRLGYSNDDIRAWSTQADPCMSLLSEWFAVRRHIEATKSILEQLIEMNLVEVAKIVENALTAAEAVISADDPIEFIEPPLIFLSYQWALQEEVKVLRAHLQKAGYRCWMDIGQMGGGDKLYEAIDRGIRGSKVFIACVTEKYSESPNCKRELNLSISLKKAVIPLQMERMSWPPPGTMGPLLTEYIFIRMFGKPGGKLVEGTFWPKDRFQELLMQIRYSCAPEYENVAEDYKNWWVPPGEDVKYISKEGNAKVETPSTTITVEEHSSVFISYQWDKQEQVKKLYQLLISKGLSCWLDIYQMGGGDSLYDKIDRGVRECKVMISCVTRKYSESANCRREVSLCDNLKKPLIPIMLEQMSWPPEGPMSMPLTQLIYVSFVDNPEEQQNWKGLATNELLRRLSEIIPELELTLRSSAKTTVNSVKPKFIPGKGTNSTSVSTLNQAKEPLRKQSLNNVKPASNTFNKSIDKNKTTDKVPTFAGNKNKNLGQINKALPLRSNHRQKLTINRVSESKTCVTM